MPSEVWETWMGLRANFDPPELDDPRTIRVGGSKKQYIEYWVGCQNVLMNGSVF